MVLSHRDGHDVLVYQRAQELDRNDEEVPDDDKRVERGHRRTIGGEGQVAVSSLARNVGKEHNRASKRLKKEYCLKGLFT